MERIPYRPQRIQNLDGIEQAIQRVDEAMLDVVASDVQVLQDASQHIVQAGGKRMRPRLVLLSYAALGGDDFDEVIPVAAALELVHTASVVHDDINDHGVVRRGRPSVNSIWGRTFALLTGDFLFTKVYELMAPYKDLNVTFSEATVALVEGETLQASAVKENNLNRQVYLDIIARKTAALFKAGGKLGALLADGDDEQVEALGRYGYYIGMAFQIIDDILDLIGDEEQLGKTAGIDMAQGKGFASVSNGNGGNGNGSNGENGHSMLDDMREKVIANIDKGRAQAKQFVDMAVAELDVLPDSVAKQQLIALGDTIIERDA